MLGVVRVTLDANNRSEEMPRSSRGGVIFAQNNVGTTVYENLVENWKAFEPKQIALNTTMKRIYNASNIWVEFSGDSGNVAILFIGLYQ